MVSSLSVSSLLNDRSEQYDDKVRISLLKHCTIINDLEELLDRKVDLVEDGELLPFAVESANNDKKLLYEITCQR